MATSLLEATVILGWLSKAFVVPLVCTSQPLHSNLKCLALCGVLLVTAYFQKPWTTNLEIQEPNMNAVVDSG